MSLPCTSISSTKSAGTAAFFTAVFLFFQNQSALGVVAAAPAPKQAFQFDLSTFRSSLNVPVSDQAEPIAMSESVMRERVKRSQREKTVEPLQLAVGSDEMEVSEMAAKLARSGRYDELATWFRKAVQHAPALKPGGSARLVDIDSKAYAMMVPSQFAAMFGKIHHNLTIDAMALRRDPALKNELFEQIKPFATILDREKLAEKLSFNGVLSVDQDALPSFARRMVKRFTVYRGPNCFHAALAFQSPLLTRSAHINVKEEEGYHRAMINYDELWRILNGGFYEVDPKQQALKYGDMMVFFEVPSNDPKDIDFKWIRHAATYLFNGYTFSKGSKSPNTPYSVRTLAEEWDTWKKYTNRLGVKVFRRSQKSVMTTPPKDLTDWLY